MKYMPKWNRIPTLPDFTPIVNGWKSRRAEQTDSVEQIPIPLASYKTNIQKPDFIQIISAIFFPLNELNVVSL